MSWAPVSLQNIINFSLDIKKSNTNNEDDIKKLKQNIEKLQFRLESNDISPRELKACKKLIEKNIELINDKSDTVNLSFKQIQSRMTDLFALITQSAESKIPVETSALPPSTLTTKPQPVLNCVFLCNIDAEDHNTAIMSRIPFALSEHVPFITTQSLVCGTDLEIDKKSKGHSFQNDLLRSSTNCHIYMQGEFVVFIPKNYPFPAEELGFDLERLRPITSISELFQGPAHAPKIEDFIKLFKADSKVKKRMILNGHGNVGYIGGLTLEHYRQLIEFLDKSGGEWLEIQSCYGGSINTIEHYYEEIKYEMHSDEEAPQENSMTPQSSLVVEEKKAQSQKQQKGPSFPICIRSIGSFVTRGSDHSKAYKDYFDNLDKYLGKSGSATVSKYKDMMREVSKNRLIPEEFNNFMQVKFSYPPQVPGGFRPLGEDPSCQIITYGELRVADIERTPHISIDGKKHIELLPLNIRIPLNIRFSPSLASSAYTVQSQGSSSTLMLGEAPIFLSMIPGSAHHLIHEVHAEGFSLLDLFYINALVYDQGDVNKAFFIGQFHTKDATYSKVVLEYGKKFTSLFFAEGDPELYYHYQLDLKTKTIHKNTLSSVEFYFSILQASRRTTSDSQALRSASGGQESEKQFETELFENSFWNNDTPKAAPLPVDVANYKKYMLKPNKQEAEAFVQSLHPESYQPVLTQAITDSDNQLIALLLNSEHVDINKKNTEGRTLLFLAAQKKNAEAVKLLIDKGADMNTPSLPYGFTPLMVAVQSELENIVDLFLQHALRLDFDAQTSQGWTVFGMGEVTHPIFKKVYEALKVKLMQKDKLEGEALATALAKHLNHVSANGYTLLSYETMKDHTNEIEELLKFGTDPYAGNPSCLSKAICERNLSMVEFWLKKNFDILKPDDKGVTALEYACLRSTPEILALLLKNIDLSTVPDATTIFTKTLNQPHLANAKLLLAAGLDISKMPLEQLLGCFIQLFRYHNLNLIDSLLDKVALPLAPITDIDLSKICHRLFEYCLSDDTLELGKRFVKLLENNLNLYDEEDYADGENFLEHALKKAKIPLMQLLLKHGADPTDTKGFECVLEKLIYKVDAEVLKQCLESAKQHNLNTAYSYKNVQVRIYEKHPHLTKTLLDKGADPTFKTYDSPSLLETIIMAGDEASLALCLKVKGLDLNSLYNTSDSYMDLVKKNYPGLLKTIIHHVPDIASKAEAQKICSQAIESNDLELFKTLMQAGFNPAQPPKYGDSIFYSLLISKPEWVEVCLDKICPNKDGNNIPSHEVLKALDVGAVKDITLKLLTQYGVKFDLENQRSKIKDIFNKQNISHIAFVLNQLPHDSKASLLNSNNYGEDFLMQAIDSDQWDLFKLYLEQGASPLIKPKYGNSVFYKMLTTKPDWLKLCLSKIGTNKESIELPAEDILTAIKKDTLHEQSLHILGEYSMNFNSSESISTLKDILKKANSINLLKFIFGGLNAECKISLLNSNSYGEDFLMQAMDSDHWDLFKLYLEQGASPLIKPKYGDSVFYKMLTTKPDWLKLCLGKIGSNKESFELPAKDILTAIEKDTLPEQSLHILGEYSMNFNSPESISTIKDILKQTFSINHLKFIFGSLNAESETALFENSLYTEKLLKNALENENFDLFKFYLEHGANLLIKPDYGDSLFYQILTAKPDWLEYSLGNIAVNKESTDLVAEDILKAIQNDKIAEQALNILSLYPRNFKSHDSISKIKKILQNSNSINYLQFIFGNLDVEAKATIFNNNLYTEKLLKNALENDNFDLFKFYLQHGANLLIKPDFGDSLFYKILTAKPDWLKLCLDTFCPNKDGRGIPLEEIFKAMKNNKLFSPSFQVLKEYGAGKLKSDTFEDIIEIIKKCREVEQIDFALSTLSDESKIHLINDNPDAGDLLKHSLYSNNLPLFELLVKHGADLHLKRGYSTLLVNILQVGAIDFLLVYLNKSCPAKDGLNIPLEELLETVKYANIDVKCLQLIKEYGVGRGNAEAEMILEKAIMKHSEGAQ